MAYTKNKKKNGIGREYRGRKPKGHNKEVQKYVDETVKEILDKANEEHDIAMKAKWAAEGRAMNRHGDVVQRDNVVMMPDKRFDHPGLYEGTSKYTPADKLAALTAYLVTGSMAKAETYCGVPAQTIYQWKRTSEWWPALAEEVKKEKNDELEAMITGIMHQSLENIVDRLENGDTYYDTKSGEFYKMPPKAKEISVINDYLFKQRALMRGDPTRRVENVSTDQRLKKLKQQFEDFSNARQIEGEVVQDD